MIKPKKEFEEYEALLWKELKRLKERFPPVEVQKKPHQPLQFEKELKGLRLFGDLFDCKLFDSVVICSS